MELNDCDKISQLCARKKNKDLPRQKKRDLEDWTNEAKKIEKEELERENLKLIIPIQPIQKELKSKKYYQAHWAK